MEAQRDAERHVGADVVADGATRTLRGEDQVHPEAAPALRRSHERVEDVGHVAGERGELVDDHHQARHGWRRGGGEATVRGHVGGARGAELLLAPAQLGLEAAQGPLGEPAVEVADDADGVGERGRRSKALPPLKSTSRKVSS